MPTHAPLLIDLPGVARLAGVQRPVPSMWRTRLAASSDPFPPALDTADGRPLFDAMAVAHWLIRTEHGNNPTPVADAAAAATPADFDIADPTHVATVDALLTLQAMTGDTFEDRASADIPTAARDVDPDDRCLVAELQDVPTDWTTWAAQLADAAYSPLAASRLLEQHHSALLASAGSMGPLSHEAEGLITSVVRTLALGGSPILAVSGIGAALAGALLGLFDDAEFAFSDPTDPATRRLRRRLALEGTGIPFDGPFAGEPRLLLTRMPTNHRRSTAEMLRALDDVALDMRDDDRALVLAPAPVLTGPLAPADERTRTDVLRSGRVRAIVRLGAGLVTTAPREQLALWVLGRETGDVPIADRFTAIADLTDVAITPSVSADLAADIVAAMGSAFDVRAHAFRFTRLVRTTTLLAARGALLPATKAAPARSAPIRELPALLDQARDRLGADAPRTAATVTTVATSSAAPIEPAAVEQLIAARHLRVLPGTRLEHDEIVDSGLVVVGPDELDDPTRIGERHVDALLFAQGHPSARLTAPGDVVFRTSPTPRAWVDPEGSKVVAFPARILRIDTADPGGLVPELVAADIAASTGGAGAWRRWMLRRVAPHAAAPLRGALADIAAQRAALLERLAALDDYSDLLTAAVVAGSVSLTASAGEPASSPE